MKLKSLIAIPVLFFCFISIPQSLISQTISLKKTTGSPVVYTGNQVSLTAQIENPVYLRISNSLSGFRKLKVGYSPTNLYGPMINPVAGGNTTLELTLCNFGTSIDWNKIQVRPQGVTANPLKIGSYVTAAGGIGKAWKTISIPLKDFDPSINFASVSYIEVPYSADAGVMDIGISSIRFTGGSVPFTWFGPDHFNNLHNGNGGSGELVARLITPALGGTPVSEVDFYCGDQFIGYTAAIPYTISWPAISAGDWSFRAVAYLTDGTQIFSDAITISVVELKASELNINISNPVASGSYAVTGDIFLSALVSGMRPPEPAWIRVTNSQTGYRKLKIGYNSASLYSPMQNVVAGGNTVMEITLRDVIGNIDWNKIQVRPQGNTAAPVTLAPYMAQAAVEAGQWKTIRIPLSAFDPTINFSAISLIELPYSLGLTGFELGISSIRFTGGTTPFVWFGDTKTDNLMNGNGGPGEMVAAVVPPTPAGAVPVKVDFYIDGQLCETSFTEPYEKKWVGISAGVHTVYAKLTDSQGNTRTSDPVRFNVGDLAPNTVLVRVTLNAPPASLMVTKAPLRYDKDFAYSLSLDDGLIDAYTAAFPLLHGGLVKDNNTVYPGLYYTDGCGNPIPFAAGISWYSVNSSGNDIHVNTPAYVTWTQLSELYNNGWKVYNHSWSHAANSTAIDYSYQVEANNALVKAKTGIDMRHFVIPSGDQNYIAPAFAGGMLTVMGNNIAFRGAPAGYQVDQPLDYSNFRLYRMLLADANHNVDNIMLKLNSVAAKSVDGTHFWWNEFTHHVGFQSSGSSLLFPLFEYYMNSVANRYGQAGADNIWMAPMQDVYEYLSVRDNAVVFWDIKGNEVNILVDYSTASAGISKGALSLLVNTDQDFREVRVFGCSKNSFRGSGVKKMINLEWAMPALKTGSAILPGNKASSETPVAMELKAWPNPFGENLSIGFSREVSGNVHLVLTDLEGKIAYDRKVVMNGAGNTLELSMQDADLRPGVYILTVVSQGSHYGSVKVVRF